MALKDLLPKLVKTESVGDVFANKLGYCEQYNDVNVIFTSSSENSIKITFYNKNKKIIDYTVDKDKCSALYTKIQERKNPDKGGVLAVSKNTTLFRKLIENKGKICINFKNSNKKSHFGKFEITSIEENIDKNQDKLASLGR